jgi:hypothetical protein
MIIVFYNERARVSAFPLTVCCEGENSIFQRGERTRNLGFYNATLNSLLQKNFYDDVIDRTHSSKQEEEEKNILNARKDGGVFRRNHQRRGGESLFSKPRRTV